MVPTPHNHGLRIEWGEGIHANCLWSASVRQHCYVEAGTISCAGGSLLICLGCPALEVGLHAFLTTPGTEREDEQT
jgi:hypothetical protein